MANERCSSGEHEWVCHQTRGDFGELSTTTPLSADGVRLIQQDPRNVEVVCPGGVVRCVNCKHVFNGTIGRTDNTPKLRDLTPRIKTFKKLKPRA